jgi:large subunit ribosomal protein L17
MRHRKKRNKLNRTKAHRKALLCNLATELFRYGMIKTTLAKAKAVSKFSESLISLAKEGTLSSYRKILSLVSDKDVAKRLKTEIAPSFSDRCGGYTQVIKLGPRHGDSAQMAIIKLVEAQKGASGDKTTSS